VVVALVMQATSMVAQSEFEPLVARLHSSRPADRIAALRAVVTSGHPDPLTAVAPTLTDPDNGVQLEAIDTILTLCLAPAPSAKMSRPFTAPNGSIAEQVFEAVPLAVLPRQVPPILVSQLLAATKDDDVRVRTAAAFALGIFGSPVMGPRTDETERALVADLPMSLRHPDPATREALVRAIGRLFEPPPHASAPQDVADAVVSALNDSDVRVRLWASDTLGWLREPRAAPALSQRLTFYKRGEEAWAALHALARIGLPENAPLFRQYLNERQEQPRVMAIEGLGRVRDPADVALITEALKNERSPAVLLAGSFAFYQLGSPTNLQALVDGLTNPATTQQARVYLTELGAQAAPSLRAYLQRPEPAVRLAVAEVLGLSGDHDSLGVLEAAARDSDASVAEAVRQALIRLRTLHAGVRVH
jgi:HEAT repeat protein